MAEGKHPLVGLIVNWGGRGKVIAALPEGRLLVEDMPRPNEPDPPPPHMHVISQNALEDHPEFPGIVAFDTVDAEQAWYDWLMATGQDKRRVVELVPPKKPPPKK